MTDWSRFFGSDAPLIPSADSFRPARSFHTGLPRVMDDRVSTDGDAWRIETSEPGFFGKLFGREKHVPLFEIKDPGFSNCLIVYRVQMKTDGPIKTAYLEMWCRLGGREYFSKSIGFGQSASGTTQWTTYETPFLLKPGQQPDRIRLNIAFLGHGTITVKEIELLEAPLRG